MITDHRHEYSTAVLDRPYYCAVCGELVREHQSWRDDMDVLIAMNVDGR